MKALKTTQGGKAIAPVVDIFPQIAVGYHDQSRVAEEMRLLRELGFERVYFVLCNPGYPTFSNPLLCLQPPDRVGFENYAFRSLVALGDPNFVYVHECHRHGMEAFAILKPYEGGGGSTVPHGAKLDFASMREETIGGERIGFDALLSRHPSLRVQRKPIPDYERLLAQPVTAISIGFCLDEISGIQPARQGRELLPTSFKLFVSDDNGRYVPYDGPCSLSDTMERRSIADANGTPLFPTPRECRVVTFSNLKISASVRYFAILIDAGERLFTIPQSMIVLHGSEGAIPCTATAHVRAGGNWIEAKKPPEERTWGMEQMPRIFKDAEQAANEFTNWGFEFDWHGSGFWGPGWQDACVYGVARGKNLWMKGTPCEAYAEVRDYWSDWVQKCVEMGYDGVDIRLQNHSGMVSDYAHYGYNEPLVDSYQKLHGVDILTSEADPLELMAIRGDFFTKFVVEASEILHAAGRQLQVHLRHCHEAPNLSSDFNELGFWAMPKVWLRDWRRIVDLADEITLKDYHFNAYNHQVAAGIKEYARSMGKRVWVHCYISQGRELNEPFLRNVEADTNVSGVLLYEVSHSDNNEINYGLIEQHGPVGFNVPAATELKRLLELFGYR